MSTQGQSSIRQDRSCHRQPSRIDRLWADDERLFLKDQGWTFLEEGMGMARLRLPKVRLAAGLHAALESHGRLRIIRCKRAGSDGGNVVSPHLYSR